MFVTIYETICDGKSKRYFSLDMDVDYTFWLYGEDREAELFVYSRRLIVSEALRWVQGDDRRPKEQRREARSDTPSHKGTSEGQFERQKQHRQLRQRGEFIRIRHDRPRSDRQGRPAVSALHSDWHTVTRRDMKEAVEALQLKRAAHDRGHDFADRIIERTEVPFAIDLWQAVANIWAVDLSQLRLLRDSLRGRRLLIEEVRRLGIHIGLLKNDSDDRLLPILQMLILLGQIQVASGMEKGERETVHRTFSKLFGVWSRHRQRHHMMRCGRCNSGADKHYRTHCAICNRECLYCEECLTMGRVRECSLFIVGGSDEQPDLDSAEIHTTHSLLDARFGSDKFMGQYRLDTKPNGRMNDRKSEHVLNEDVTYVDKLLERWQLSPAQQSASREALAFVTEPSKREGEQFLIWAVTVAGNEYIKSSF